MRAAASTALPSSSPSSTTGGARPLPSRAHVGSHGAWRGRQGSAHAHAPARPLPGRWGATPAARRATWSGRACRAPPTPNDSRRLLLRHHRTRRPTRPGSSPPVALRPRALQFRGPLALAQLPGTFVRGCVRRPRRASMLPVRPGGRRNLSCLRPWTDG